MATRWMSGTVWKMLLLAACGALNGMAAPEEAKNQLPDFGGVREDFVVGKQARRGFVLLPRSEAVGKRPWVWYAPTLGLPQSAFPNTGQHAWIFRQLLTNGFAIAGVDVGESYGSPSGCDEFTEFYKHMVGHYGLLDKACLLPQSRGGLMLMNWASTHPEAVECIGAIYPVCDLGSYPGLGNACGAYGLRESELPGRLREFNPIERLEPLAKRHVPLLLLHGDTDSVVPLERNSGELARRYRKLGGQVELVILAGKGHDNSSAFFRNQVLIDFFIRHGKAAINAQ